MKLILKTTIALLVLAVFISSCQKDIILNSANANLTPPTADAGIPQTIHPMALLLVTYGV
jgi:hypothetical protein